jgi:hypothetical protein
MVVMWRNRSGLIVVFALGVVAACGGSREGDSRTDPLEPVPVVVGELRPIEVGDAIVTSLGADEGFAAVLYALDAGYTVEQLSTAALDGTLASTGAIADVEPHESPNGLITSPVVANGFAGHPFRGGETEPAVIGSAASDDTAHEPDEVQAAINAKMAMLDHRQTVGHTARRRRGHHLRGSFPR